MSRNPPLKVSKSQLKAGVAELVKAAAHLGEPRQPTIAETALKFPCTRCAAEGKERAFYNVMVAFGGAKPSGFVLSCKKCSSLILVSTHKEDALDHGGKFMREALSFAAQNGWREGKGCF